MGLASLRGKPAFTESLANSLAALSRLLTAVKNRYRPLSVSSCRLLGSYHFYRAANEFHRPRRQPGGRTAGFLQCQLEQLVGLQRWQAL